MLPDLPPIMWAYLLMFALPWVVIFGALAWAEWRRRHGGRSARGVPEQELRG